MKFVILIMLVLTFPALAQTPTDAQLDTAMGVCAKHLVTPPVPKLGDDPHKVQRMRLLPPFEAGWEKCNAIRAEIIARKNTAGLAQQQQDINGLAGKLGK